MGCTIKVIKCFVIFSFLLLIHYGCRLRDTSKGVSFISSTNFENIPESIIVRKTVVPQYIVRPKMIFKFYCKDNEKIPDCEEYDVMRMDSFLRATGSSQKVIYDYKQFLTKKKSHDDSKKKLMKLDESYKAAIEKKGEVLPAQQREYTRMKIFYELEIKRFNQYKMTQEVKDLDNNLQDSKGLEKYFEAEVGDIESSFSFTCSLTVTGDLKCWGDDSLGQVTGWREKVRSGDLKLPARDLKGSHFNFCVIGADGKVICWGRNDEVVFPYRVDLQIEKFNEDKEIKLPIHAFTIRHKLLCVVDSVGGGKCASVRDGRKNKVYRLSEFNANGILTFPPRIFTASLCGIDYQEKLGCMVGDRFEEVVGVEAAIKNGKLKLPFRQLVDMEGSEHCVLDSIGNPYCWESDEIGKLIQEGKLTLPLKYIVSFEDNSCAISEDSKITCWGQDSAMIVSNIESAIANSHLRLPLAKIHTHENGGCAIDSRRTLYCWGNNLNGAVNGRKDTGYKVGEFGPEDFATDLTQLGFYEE